MREQNSGSGRNRNAQDDGQQERVDTGGDSQADGSDAGGRHREARHRAASGRQPGRTDWNFDTESQNAAQHNSFVDRGWSGGANGGSFDQRQRSNMQRSREPGGFGDGRTEGMQGSTGMGAFGEGDFQGGTGGMGGFARSGYGQSPDMNGGYGQGSGYAQSSGEGGYGQGARHRGGSEQSGAHQRSDERYGYLDSDGRQHGSEYGYGGRGTDQQRGHAAGSRFAGGSVSQQHVEQQGHMERKGEHQGKGPKGYQRSDERIREDVSEALYHDGDVDASEIDIEVSSGEITLTGTVASRMEKRHAEEVAERCAGVKDVQNRLRIQSPTPASRSAPN